MRRGSADRIAEQTIQEIRCIQVFRLPEVRLHGLVPVFMVVRQYHAQRHAEDIHRLI